LQTSCVWRSLHGDIVSGIVKDGDTNFLEISLEENSSRLLRRGVLVGYHVKVIQGTANFNQVNNIDNVEFANIIDRTGNFRNGGRPANDKDAGEVVFEETILFASLSDAFGIPGSHALEHSTAERIQTVTIPPGILSVGQSYTAQARSVLAYPPGEVEETATVSSLPSFFADLVGDIGGIFSQQFTLDLDRAFEFVINARWAAAEIEEALPFYSQWGIDSAKINEVPVATNLQVNNEVSPGRVASKKPVSLGFLLSDPDGPSLEYKIEVGNFEENQFSPSMWDSGWVPVSSSPGDTLVSNVQYQGQALAQGRDYFWRARGRDGLGIGTWSEVNNFGTNTPPQILSLKVDGMEALFGSVPNANSAGPVISWQYSSEEAPQQAFELVFRQEDKSAEQTINGTGETSEATLPAFDPEKRVFLRLTVSDGIEETTEEITLLSNTPPQVTQLLTEALSNPTTLSTTTPTFSWSFQDRSQSLQQAFRIQVASDPDFSTLTWDSGEVTSMNNFVTYGSTASPVVPPVALTHAVFFVRVAVNNGVAWSELSDSPPAFFAINGQPGAPTLLSPLGGRHSGAITVSWMPASPADPDGDDITYQVEITDVLSTGTGWRRLVGPLPEGQTSYVIGANDLPAGEDYGVRVISSDGISPSDPATSIVFAVENHAPISPVFSSPGTGETAVRFLRVEWIEADPVDVDGDDVTYKLEITSGASDTTPLWRLVGTFGAGTTGTTVDVSEEEDGSDFQLRVTAIDEHGKNGDANLSPGFAVSNVVEILDAEIFEGDTYLATSDGRLVRLEETAWQVRVDWAEEEDVSSFQVFKSERGEVQVRNGEIVFESPPGETAILREE
jgi:hypothetical protein